MSVLALLAPPRSDPPPDQAKPLSARFVMGVAGVVLAAFLASLDERLSVVGNRDLLGGFGLGRDEGSWIETSYALGQIVALPAAPWLGQTFSIRRVTAFLLALGTLAAVAAPVAPSYGVLLGLRLLQGIGDGGLLPMMLGTMISAMPRNRRGEALTVYAFVLVLASLVSPSLEGVYADLFVWRSLFWSSVVLAPIAMFIVLACMPVRPIDWEAFRGADTYGIFALTAGSGFLVVGLGQGQRLDWFDSPFIDAAFLLAGWFLAAFFWNEATCARPLYRLATFRKRNFSVGLVMIFIAAMTLLSPGFLLSQEQETVRQLRPLQIGNILLPLVPEVALAAAGTAVLLRLLDARLVAALGFGLIVAGLRWSTWLTPEWYRPDWIPTLLVQAPGWIMALSANALITTSVLAPEDALTGAASFNLVRTFGLLGGTAILDGIVNVRDRVHSNDAIAAHLDIARPPVRERLMTEGLGALQQAQHVQSTVMAIADAYGWLAIIALCAFPVILLQQPAMILRFRARGPTADRHPRSNPEEASQ